MVKDRSVRMMPFLVRRRKKKMRMMMILRLDQLPLFLRTTLSMRIEHNVLERT